MSGSPRFDDQTSPQSFEEVHAKMDARCLACPPIGFQYFTGQPISNLDNDACLLDPPVILWDKITQRNYIVLDCFSSQMFEETTYWQLHIPPTYVWRRDDQVEEQAIFHGYDAGDLCAKYHHWYNRKYSDTAASIKRIIELLLSRKCDVGGRTRDGGREIIGDLSDMIVRAMHWREDGGLGYE